MLEPQVCRQLSPNLIFYFKLNASKTRSFVFVLKLIDLNGQKNKDWSTHVTTIFIYLRMHMNPDLTLKAMNCIQRENKNHIYQSNHSI